MPQLETLEIEFGSQNEVDSNYLPPFDQSRGFISNWIPMPRARGGALQPRARIYNMITTSLPNPLKAHGMNSEFSIGASNEVVVCHWNGTSPNGQFTFYHHGLFDPNTGAWSAYD